MTVFLGKDATKLKWSGTKKATVGPLAGEVTKWNATGPVVHGFLYWSITQAASDRFVLRVKDDNRSDTIWLGYRRTLEQAKALAQSLQDVLDTKGEE